MNESKKSALVFTSLAEKTARSSFAFDVINSIEHLYDIIANASYSHMIELKLYKVSCTHLHTRTGS